MYLPTPNTYQQQLTHKQQRLANLLAPYNAPSIEIFESPTEYYRMRTEFRLWRDNQQLHYAMFKVGEKHQPILLDSFPVASQQINELMPKLKEAWQASEILANKLFQVEFLTTLTGDALITLCYHQTLDTHWQAAAEQLAQRLHCSIIGRSRKQRLVIGKDYVLERFQVADKTYHYIQPEGAFTQPNAVVCNKMLNWAYEVIGERSDDLLELYCGNGNFTLPLSTRVRKVLATEISKTSVKAALQNISNNQITNITLARLSAEELTQALNKVRPFNRLSNIDLDSYQFGTVFVDPPRAGIDKDTCELVRQFPRILYISCNPDTLMDNIKQLANTHHISRCALFDQFPYTHHMECGVLLERSNKDLMS